MSCLYMLETLRLCTSVPALRCLLWFIRRNRQCDTTFSMHDDDGPRINGMVERDPLGDHSLQRRDFFKGAGTLAGLIGAAGLAQAQQPAGADQVPAAAPGPLLPVVPFGKHKITRLIAGANPIYGYSHFNYVYSAHMADYHTTPRVLSFLGELERAGLTTWHASWR